MGVAGGVVDDLAEQLVEGAAELGPRREPDRDQVAAVHREVGEPVRLLPLVLQHPPEAPQLLDVFERRRPARAALAEEVGLLVVDELEGDLVAVLREEAPSAELVARMNS